MREVCARFGSEYLQAMAREKRYPEEFVEALTKAKWLAALIPTEYGGLGYGRTFADIAKTTRLANGMPSYDHQFRAMMQAVKRFDPDRGFRLATYAMWWIRAAIQEYILHSWSLVKMGTTAAQKKLFFNLRRLKGQMQAIEDGDLQPEQVDHIATTLGVSDGDVISMNRRLAAPDHSLNAPVRADSEGEWQDWLVDDAESQEQTLAESEEFNGRKALLGNAMQTLNERERHILTERRLSEEPSTLEDLSQHYGISRERVRQIEVRAFEKVQKAMKTQVTTRRLADQAA